MSVASRTNIDGQTFGSWLLARPSQTGIVGRLIEGAKVDRAFPRYGTPDEVRAHLSSMQAEAALLAAVDDAENDWMRH